MNVTNLIGSLGTEIEAAKLMGSFSDRTGAFRTKTSDDKERFKKMLHTLAVDWVEQCRLVKRWEELNIVLPDTPSEANLGIHEMILKTLSATGAFILEGIDVLEEELDYPCQVEPIKGLATRLRLDYQLWHSKTEVSLAESDAFIEGAFK